MKVLCKLVLMSGVAMAAAAFPAMAQQCRAADADGPRRQMGPGGPA